MEQTETAVHEAAQTEPGGALSGEVIVAYLLTMLEDQDVDRPEVWDFIGSLGGQTESLLQCIEALGTASLSWHADLLRAIGLASLQRFEQAEEILGRVMTAHSQSPLANGAMFRVKHMESPDDPKFRLTDFVCDTPFRQLDVLETSSHLCCASWLPVSAGNLHRRPWQDVWNSPAAQRVRASMLDGSYRYCNKMACPHIMAGTLPAKKHLAETDPWWSGVIQESRTQLDRGPAVVNLAYDRTCNLTCPSCRQTVIFQNHEQREKTEEMQTRNIVPMLAEAETVMVTGSGDPFSSPTFRKLLKGFDPTEYPRLKINLMTNGMLLTPKRWEEYAHLAGHVGKLKFSLDGATRETHELLRRGSRWDRVLENLHFCGELLARGDIAAFEIVFVVQQENFREMGQFVDLGHEVGANSVYFARITNWGTFTEGEYARKAVFIPSHPDYAAFLETMRDPRLKEPVVILGDLAPFAL